MLCDHVERLRKVQQNHGTDRRTVTAGDSLLIERLLKVGGEGVRTAVAAAMPCLRGTGRRLRYGSHWEM